MSEDRTGDVLSDAAKDLEDDWPWYANAFRLMRDALEKVKSMPDGDSARVAAAGLMMAKMAAEGEEPSESAP